MLIAKGMHKGPTGDKGPSPTTTCTCRAAWRAPQDTHNNQAADKSIVLAKGKAKTVSQIMAYSLQPALTNTTMM